MFYTHIIFFSPFSINMKTTAAPTEQPSGDT